MALQPPRGRSRLVSALFNPTALTCYFLLLYLLSVLIPAYWDPFAFVRIGSRYQAENAVEEEGYDGQFVYFIARDLNPESVSPYLDVPAYRYQRILLPVLASLISFGRQQALPWALVFIGLATHLAGTALMARWFTSRGLSRWYALVYGLWVGFFLAVRLDLPEPLAYGLVLAGLTFGERHPRVRWVLFGLALFAKEVAILFIAGQMLADLFHKRWTSLGGMALVALLPYAIFQGWLFNRFGAFGIGSGGAMATSFEVVPFMGWLRILSFDFLITIAFGLVLVPFFYFPAVWGIVRGVRSVLGRQLSMETGMLLANALVIPFLPFSTVREPGGLFRFGCGLVLAFLLFGAETKYRRLLNYSFLWLVLGAILLNG